MTTSAGPILAALKAAATTEDGQQARLLGDDGSYTLAEVVAQSERLAATLSALGVQPGDRVAHLGKNSAALLILLFACARMGCVLMPLNWRLSGKEWAWMLDDAAPRVLLTLHGYQTQAAELGVPTYDLGALIARGSADDRVPDTGRGGDDLLLVYTSGSTGRPKGAVHGQDAVWANAQFSAAMHDYNLGGRQDRVLTILPMFHVGGLAIQTLSALLSGAQVRVMTAFEPNQMAALHESFKPTLTLHVPATLQAMLALPAWSGLDLSDLRAVAIGSTDVPLGLISALQDRGIPALQVYGATESGPISIFQTVDQALAQPGSIGTAPRGVEIKLRNASGAQPGLNEPGEILIKAPNLASRYWPDKPLIDNDGFWASGDVASVDAQGVYWFRDRLKNVVISGGENIYPAEIERVLRGIAGIADCCVVGVPSARWGQTPVAVIEGEARALEPIQKQLSDELARYKHPRRIIFVDALPRNAMGKVVRDDVRALVLE